MENNNTKEFTMGYGKVNLIAFLLVIPISILTIGPFLLIWDMNKFIKGFELFNDYILIILIGGVIVHEFLHGITWAIYAKNGFKSIQFGVKWSMLTPYCHCREPLKLKNYRIGVAMPLIVLGILPVIISLLSGNGFLVFFGTFFSWAAGGDIIGLFMLRNLDRDMEVSDHPDKMGFYIKESLE